MSTTTQVPVLPDCDLCGASGISRTAVYDARTTAGPWAYLCEDHWSSNGIGQLGTGFGQRLVEKGAHRYVCANPGHTNCLGPTGVHIPAKCELCGTACHTNTCWQKSQRVPSTTPVLCDACSTQGVLL